jgi:hypothetical protein
MKTDDNYSGLINVSEGKLKRNDKRGEKNGNR